MTRLHRVETVPFTPEQMFVLINDVESYPQFMPWCTKGVVLSKSEDEIIGSIEMSAAGVHKSFTTRNQLIKNQSIMMEHLEGPFKHLRGTWTLIPKLEGGCEVDLDLDFEVHSGIAGKLFGMLYNKVADKLVECFVLRAYELYGK